ncbi:MAG: UvrD-helicase domain-containing protein [Ignavibacteriales bacterium]|nr:UvrD-helicase domain-containing protein [Ignavibacteriales bacterium]
MSEIQREQLTSYQKAALNYKKHISLTANAGSGKTFVLSKRYVEIALKEDIPLRNLVAITFTEKAAGELYKKIAKEIDDRLNETQDLSTLSRLERIRKELISANISTIHSFCNDILKEFSTEAEIDANFQLIDDLTKDELIDVCLEEYFDKTLNSDNSEDLKYLIRVVGSIKNTKTQLKYLIGERKNILHTIDKLYILSAEELAEKYNKLFQEKLESLFRDRMSSIVDDIKKINKQVLSNKPDSQIGISADIQLKKIITEKVFYDKFKLLSETVDSILTGKNEVYSKGYLDKNRDDFRSEISNITNFFLDIKEIKLSDNSDQINVELAKFSKICATVFLEIYSIVEEKKRINGFIDYEDMLILTEKIISNDYVRNYLSSKFNYIMIDEYQDTNEIQYNIFIPLLHNFKKNNLFVVGDEKQSIYKFRGAELEIFNTTKSELRKLGESSDILSLPHSFRMSPPIAGFVNYIFPKIFANPNPEFNEVEYDELICTKSPNDIGQIQFLFSKEGLQTESELTALTILDLVNNKKCDFRDIAILCRKRKYFSELENTFTNYKIPYSIVGGRGFYQQQFIYDIYNYISFLLNNNDDIALVGILRSPFYFISDSEIAYISTANGVSFYEKLKEVSENENQYKKIIDLFEQHNLLARTIEINLLVRKILIDTGYLGVVSSAEKSRQDLVNIEKLINIANEFSKKSFKSPYDFQTLLKDLINKYEDEGQADVNEDLNTVNIMTIHQAKGLEFKVVFFYKSNNPPKKDNIKKSKIDFSKDFGFLSKIPINNEFSKEFGIPPITLINNYIENKKSIAEENRLLYVALTRAVENLFIIAKIGTKIPVSPNTFLATLNNSLNINFEESEKVISYDLPFMEITNDEEKIYKKNINISIPLVYQLEDRKIENIEFESEEGKSYLIDESKDMVKNEIISATKISIYNQCPVRYQLIYEIGYSAIFNVVKKYYNDFEFKLNEDEEVHQYSDVKGLVIHSLLEKKLDLDNLKRDVNSQLKSRLKFTQVSNNEFSKLSEDIISLLQNFYKSNTYRELEKYKNFENEYEIYIKKDDYYLYGIIDKLIFDDNKIVIVDYKTDDIKEKEIQDRANNYLIQLTFYSYLISCSNPKVNNFEIRIIFVQHPENVFVKTITKTEFNRFEIDVNKVVQEIRAGKFNPNYNFCKNCYFYFENKCIKERNKL